MVWQQFHGCVLKIARPRTMVSCWLIYVYVLVALRTLGVMKSISMQSTVE